MSNSAVTQWVSPVTPLYVAHDRFWGWGKRSSSVKDLQDLLEDVREELREGVRAERVHAIGVPIDGSDADLMYLVKDCTYPCHTVFPFEEPRDAREWLHDRLCSLEQQIERMLSSMTGEDSPVLSG